MLDALLDADALGELLAHLPPGDLLRCAAVCSAWRRKILTSRDLWAPHFGGMDALDDASRLDVSGAPLEGAPGSLARALAVRRAALANWRSPEPVVKQWVLEPSNAHRMGMVHALAIDDMVLATGGSDHCVWLWDLKTRRDTQRLQGHAGAVRCLLLKAKRGTVWSGSWDKTIREWDIKTGECRRTLAHAHERCIMAMALVDDYTLVSAGGEGRVVWWDLTTGWRVRTCRHVCPVLSLALGDDGHTRAVWADGRVRVYDNARARATPHDGRCMCDEGRGICLALSDKSSDTETENEDEAGRSTPARAADVEPVATLPGPVTPAWEGPAQPMPRMPNGEPMPAELLAFYHAQGGNGAAPYVDARIGPGPGTLMALCSHNNLIVDRVLAIPDEDSGTAGGAGGRRSAELSIHACAGAGACCTLLPEASVAVGGCRTIQPAMNNGVLGGPQLVIHAEGAKRPPARIPLLLSPAALAARWDILVVGTQRGRIHIFDFAAVGGRAKHGHVLHSLLVPQWYRNLYANYAAQRHTDTQREEIYPRTALARQLNLLGSPVMVAASAVVALLLGVSLASSLLQPVTRP
mmetsp:Transcript_21246/g.54751  ORF Transcript_21246/g.54751 Transcript_21246/m.54751 type:complete len:579 (-) Transcript_21246:3522-5258(-)